ncbi:HAMP domain-containing histidine kinase [Candidatus Sulfurimonas marisnigri]|uniref:histidine kinase n=1 Tax=Candidatus Sulfurimonas marisnigri TaxID=2740405 RepID=A0A7S7M0B4_9BACT|nr:HAMP domain-containing sensor histidine kinase [Candidatus Sulfurimonas marisnigri]QOY54213.1 HAMP domain-containing histidine kinase [Candidatus Sulfurimonas marisnigri]
MFSINSLFAKTFILIVTIVIVVVILFSYSIINNQKNALMNVLYSQANTVVRSISLVTSDAMVVDDESFIVEHVQKVLKDNSEIKYIIFKKRGGQSIYSDSSKWLILDALPKIIIDLEADEVKSNKITSELYDEKVYHFNYPIMFTGIKWGWISVGLSLERYNKNMQSIYRDSLLLVLGMLFVSILFSFMITVWLVKPILILNRAARNIAAGDFTNKVDILQKDEIGELASSFNYMVDALKASDKQLRGYNDELEQHVAERTEELNLLNKQLDQRVKEEVFKRTEQEQILIQQSRFASMGEMIGNIAHQWRQPLNALSLLMQNIEFAYESDSLNEAYIKRVVEKGNNLTQSMSQTIDDFRNFFKPNKDTEVFSYAKAYESTMDILGSSIVSNMIEINESINTNVCVNGFKSEFSQVILNILNNSKDALMEKKDGKRLINVSIYKEGEFAYFSIEDNAGGIKNEIIEKVFDPYFTTKDEGKGTGIGLYMSKTIIENNMHGKLKVKNNNIGACFTIKIKLSPCEKK